MYMHDLGSKGYNRIRVSLWKSQSARVITDESENYIKSACNIAVPHGSISGDRATLSSRSITEAAEFSSACLWARAAAAAKAFCTTSVDIAPTGPGWQSTPVLNSNAPCNGKSSPNRHSKHLAPTSISITCFTHNAFVLRFHQKYTQNVKTSVFIVKWDSNDFHDRKLLKWLVQKSGFLGLCRSRPGIVVHGIKWGFTHGSRRFHACFTLPLASETHMIPEVLWWTFFSP